MGAVLRFDEPELLRVARAADVLHNCGQILASCAGTEGSYKLSSPAHRIQVFISHNWAFERKRKFLALAMHFNLGVAVAAAMAAMLLGACFTYIGARRNWSAITLDKLPITCIGTMLTFFIMLLFGHECSALLGFKGKSVFLDKACIHQTDPMLKERGIVSLGAFLHRSDAIVVCFTDLYLKRLWTVYEFASFLLIHGEAPELVYVVPANLPVLLLASSLCALCGVFASRADWIVTGSTAVISIVGGVATDAIFVGLARCWARQQFEARAIFEEFALADTLCASELDRELVHCNIVGLMRHLARVDGCETDEQALLAFDEFVRTAGSRAFVASVGRLGVQYKLLLPILLVVFSNGVQMWSAAAGYRYRAHRDALQIALMLLAHVSTAFTVFPLAAALILYLTKCFPRLRGVAQVMYCASVALVSFAAVWALSPLDGPARSWLLDPALALGRSCLGFVLYCVALFAMTACVYRQPQRPVDASAASPEGVGSGLPVVKLDTGTTVDTTCEVGAAALLSPGQAEDAEQGACWKPEVEVAVPDDCQVDPHSRNAGGCSVPPNLQLVGNIIEASGTIVELRTA